MLLKITLLFPKLLVLDIFSVVKNSVKHISSNIVTQEYTLFAKYNSRRNDS